MWPEKTVEDAFVTKEIYVWRMALAVFWSIIIQVIFLSWFIFIINVNLLHPYVWFVNWFGTFASIGTWLNIFPLIVIIFSQGVLCSKDYINGPPYYRTRFEMMRKVISVHNLVMGSLHAFVGITIAYIYTSLCGSAYNSLTVPCTTQASNAPVGLCLVEKRFFLICGGIWIGLYYFLSGYIFGTKNLVFPPIQQYKFIQVKANFVQNLKQSMSDTLFPTLLFLVLYYFRGGYLRTSFCSLFSLNFITDPVDSLFGIINVTMILFLWFLSSLFFVTLRLMELLFNIHLTEHCKYPITSPMPTCQGLITLPDALAMSSLPIIQHLGYLDLFILSEKEKHRREELFTLSQPGGHPHSWNKVSQQCFRVISSFTAELDKTLHESYISVNFVRNDKLYRTSQVCCGGHNIRNLSAAGTYDYNYVDQRTALQRTIDDFVGTIQNTFHEKVAAFYRKPIIVYFFGVSQENRVRYLLCMSQPIIWAIQSLSYLACASLTEDKYGIVQKDLVDIITSLVYLKQTLEKVSKFVITVKRTNASNMCDARMITALKSAVKRSLYKIAIRFSPYVKDIGLPADAEQQMMGFIEFREV